MRALFVVVRLIGAVAIAAAMLTQLVNNYAFWVRVGITDLSSLPVNFFSFFTIESNVFTAVVFVIGAIVLLRGGEDPGWFGRVRGGVTAYMLVVGVVYNLLLRGVNVAEGLVIPWTNEVLHVVAPLLIVLDWLLAPGRLRLPWSTMGLVVGFPILWAVYTMVRGPFAVNALAGTATWYPYPFLDPANGGYGTVALYVLLIAAFFALAGVGTIAVSRRRPRWPLPGPAAVSASAAADPTR